MRLAPYSPATCLLNKTISLLCQKSHRGPRIPPGACCLPYLLLPVPPPGSLTHNAAAYSLFLLTLSCNRGSLPGHHTSPGTLYCHPQANGLYLLTCKVIRLF